MDKTYFIVMISAFPIFCFSLCFLPLRPPFPLVPSLPPHSSSVFISSSLRQNKLQPKASTFQTFNATQGALSLPQSGSVLLARTYAQESTCLSAALSLFPLHAAICLSLALFSFWLRGEWDKVHWEQNNRAETQTPDVFGGSSLSFRNHLNSQLL